MRKTLIAALLLTLASPAMADVTRAGFLSVHAVSQKWYLQGYIAGRDHENLMRPGLQDAAEVNGPGRLDCNGLRNGEISDLMMISLRRSSYDSLDLALAEAFSRVCKYR